MSAPGNVCGGRPSAALIIGGSGYLGQRLATVLRQEGWDVTGFDLAPPQNDRATAFFLGDRFNPSHLNAALAQVGEGCTVFDLISYDAPATELLVRAARGFAGRLVHLSTASVYQRLLALVASERDVEFWPAEGLSYMAGKRRAELVLEHEDCLETVILRSAPVIGCADPVSREAYFLARLRRGVPLVHPGPLEGRVNMLLVDDLIDALASAASAQNAAGRAYHLLQADCPTLKVYVDTLAALSQTTPRWAITPPQDLIAQGYRLTAFPYPLGGPHSLDITAARQDLGFAPTPWPEAIKAVVAALGEDELDQQWPGQGSMQARLAGTTSTLHAALERHQARPTSFMAAMGFLEGAPGSVLTPTARRRAGGQAAVIVPPSLLLCEQGGSPLSPSSSSSSSSPPAPLAAEVVRVPTLSGQSKARLFRVLGPDPRQSYGHDGPPEELDLVPFSALDPANLPAEGLPILATLATAEDRHAWQQWQERTATAGIFQSSTAQGAARLHVLQRLAVPSTAGGQWGNSFAAVRLLLRAAIIAPHEAVSLSIEPTAPPPQGGAFLSLPPSWVLLHCQGSHVLLDLSLVDGGEHGRVFRLDPTSARLLSIAASVSNSADCLEAFACALHRPATQLCDMMVEGLATLSAQTGLALRHIPALSTP